jgi:hypothetical protein
MTVVCRHERTVNNPTAELEFSISDKIILINERNGTEWYGQNIRTRNFGTFPRSGIAVETPEPIKQQSSPYKKLDNQEAQFLHRREISCPITGRYKDQIN